MKPKPFNAPLVGAGLGALVAIVLALWLLVTPSVPDIEGSCHTFDQRVSGSIIAVTMMLAPSMISGALIGHFAPRLRLHPWLRRMAIVGAACLIVLGLGAITELCEYVPGACVPVVVAALYMEHRTRTSAPIPIAIASQVR